MDKIDIILTDDQLEAFLKLFDTDYILSVRKFSLLNRSLEIAKQDLGQIFGGKITAEIEFDNRIQENDPSS